VVHEYFADFLVINPDLFSLGFGGSQRRIWSTSPDMWNGDGLVRSAEGVLAVLLSLKKRPLVRYEKNSALAKKLAAEIRYQIAQEDQLFDFGRRADTPPILLILDRRNDPITPLLSQWTYQAMVHELLGIHNGRVDLSEVPDVRPELRVWVTRGLINVATDSGLGNCAFTRPGPILQEEYVSQFRRPRWEHQGLCGHISA